MKMKTLISLLIVSFCLQMSATGQNLSNKETAVHMLIGDTICRAAFQNLALFIESKDSLYFMKAMKNYSDLDKLANKTASNEEPDNQWRQFFQFNATWKKMMCNQMSKNYFSDKEFFNSILNDKDVSKNIIGKFTKAQNISDGDMIHSQIACSELRKKNYEDVIRSFEQANNFITQSTQIVKSYDQAK